MDPDVLSGSHEILGTYAEQKWNNCEADMEPN